MNRRSRAHAVDEKYHRFLRPGALARLRDSRIRPRSDLKLLFPASPSAAAAAAEAPQVPDFEHSPCFSVRTYGPRFPQRKKLLAAKRIIFLPPAVTAGLDGADLSLDAFSADLVPAH